MKKILELLFCMIALIGLLVCVHHADDIKNANTDDVLTEIIKKTQDNAAASAECVSMVDNQK